MPDRLVLGIYRESIFSPGKIMDDAKILDAVLARLAGAGFRTEAVSVAELPSRVSVPRRVLSMAQSEPALRWLEQREREGTRVINRARGVRNCYRKALTTRLDQAGIPQPAGTMLPVSRVADEIDFAGGSRYWLKRGDVHAIQQGDVVQVLSRQGAINAATHFRAVGVPEVLVQEHLDGPVIKFYGVAGGAYFFATDTGTGADVTAPMAPLAELAAAAAAAADLEIYGGDAVLPATGSPVLIDLNDWPSFSKCRAAAAERIAGYITDQIRSE